MNLKPLERVVLLGGSGFLGTAMSSHLEQQGVCVHVFSSAALDMRRPDAFSVLDPLADSTTTLIVLAGLAPRRGITLETFTQNISIATNIARYLEQHGVRKCVFFSSDAIYPFNDLPVTETLPAEPDNYYALAKYTSEQILSYATSAAGVPLLVVRPTGIYGPGDPHNSYGPNRFVRTALGEGLIRLFGEGEEQRDHLYVDDAVRLSVELAASDETGVVNLATGRSYSFAQVVDALRPLVRTREFIVEHMPRRSAVTHRHFDIARLRRAVPDFAFTPLEDGLREAVAAAERRT